MRERVLMVGDLSRDMKTTLSLDKTEVISCRLLIMKVMEE